MRTYSNFLLFEEVLLELPDTSQLLKQAFDSLYSPLVEIVEEDCHTFLGKSVPVFYNIEGLVELSTDEPLSRTRITELLSSGKYTVKTRSQYSCTSSGGLCKKCYLSNLVNRNDTVSVGQKIKLSPAYVYQTDLITGDGTNSYALSEVSENYDSLVVIQNGEIITEPYQIIDNYLTFQTAKNTTEIFVVHFIKESTNPFLGYLASSFSGSLLGLSPLPTETLIIKPSLYSLLLSEGYLLSLQRELENIKDIPYTLIDYLDRISDPLEKALYMYYLYVVYGSFT